METTLERGPLGLANANHTKPSGQNDGIEIRQVKFSNPTTTPQAVPQGYTLPPMTSYQAPVPSLGNPSHLHIPNANPAVVLMFHPYYGIRGLPYGYPTENPQPRDMLQMLEERLWAVE